MADKENKSEVAKEKPRDARGHFIREDKGVKKDSPVEHLLKESVRYSKTEDDILNVKVGNPLKRITQLLEQIKKQKAFSFTLKGSLGVMGIALVVGTFGIFGGEKILCNKGTQSKIGYLRILQTQDPEASNVPLFGGIIDWIKISTGQAKTYPRVILVQQDNNTISIPYSINLNTNSYLNSIVIVSGNYDSCAQVLKPHDNTSFEVMN